MGLPATPIAQRIEQRHNAARDTGSSPVRRALAISSLQPFTRPRRDRDVFLGPWYLGPMFVDYPRDENKNRVHKCSNDALNDPAKEPPWLRAL